MQIAVASDHAGFWLKGKVLEYLAGLGHNVEDLGTSDTSPVDYPDFAALVAAAIHGQRAERAVLLCGSGVGASVAVNKFPGIRAGLCHDTYSAHQGVEHISAARSQPYYLDVTHPQANKGGVVLAMSKLLNIPATEIATIGDMPNNVLMFEKSGVSIAMGNASSEVQASATYVTSTNEEEGFARAVEEFVLAARAANA